MQPIMTKDGFHLQGEVGQLIQNVTKNWLIGLRESNPAILDMYHDRDKYPYRDMLPWSGEFSGKYITGAYYVYRTTRDPILYEYIQSFLDEMLSCIDDDGYIGCFPKDCRLTGVNIHKHSEENDTWDTWAHYHVMFGLYVWYKETGRRDLYEALLRIAELFLSSFYQEGKRRLIEVGNAVMNLAPLHIFALLYLETKDERYLRFCREIEQDLHAPTAGDYIDHALGGGEFYQCRQPRWESMHTLLGIAAMERCTGDRKYLQAALLTYQSILRTDVHNTGAFSTEEQALGNPFDNRNVELCCVIAYNALACEMYHMTGDPAIVDFLERSFYNAIMGSFSPSGRWSTYNTPMEGVKCANYHSIVFQCRPGSPELNCCSANAARGLGMLSEWAFTMQDTNGYLNFYETCHLETPEGTIIDVAGDYPADPHVHISLRGRMGRTWHLRIPEWSIKTRVVVGNRDYWPSAGGYWQIEAEDDAVDVDVFFDFTPHFIQGGGDYEGKSSIFIGPVLYGYDISLNQRTEEALPPVELWELSELQPKRQPDGRITLTFKNGMVLSDFYRLGSSGSAYRTWFACQ